MPGDTSSHAKPELRDYLQVVRRRKWIILVVAILVTALTLGHSLLETPRYAATVKILVQRQSSASLIDAASQRVSADLAAEIELQYFNSEDVRGRAADELGYSAGATATSSGEGAVLVVRGVDGDATRAADIANAYARAYVESRREATINDYANTAQAVQSRISEIDQEIDALDTRAPGSTTTTLKGAAPTAQAPSDPAAAQVQRDALVAKKAALEKTLDQVDVGAEAARGGGPQILQTAKPPSEPFQPSPRDDAAVGLLLGLFLGVGAGFLVDYLDDSIRQRSDLEVATGGVPLLAIIPRVPSWKHQDVARLISVEQPSSPAAEAYRTLRTSVQFAGIERPIKALQVTSPKSQDGKSTTAANLAVAAARAGQRVILIDCDLRRPRLHDFFGLSNQIGFTSVLMGEGSLVDAAQQVPGISLLRVLPSGPVPPDPSELLSSRRCGEVLGLVREAADLVIIDSPPVLPVSDALILSNRADALMLVVAADATTRKETSRAVELLRQVDAPVIGSVLNAGHSESSYESSYRYDAEDHVGASPTSTRAAAPSSRQEVRRPAPTA